MHILHLLFFFKDFIYFYREGKGGREVERNVNVWLLLARPLLGTQPKPRACALTGNQTTTLWFAGRCSVHRATPARAAFTLIYLHLSQH